MRSQKHLMFLGGMLLLLCSVAFSGIFAPHAFAASVTRDNTTHATASCPPQLQPGDKGSWVVVLQEQLNSAYLSGTFSNSPHSFHPYSQSSTPLAPDGIYGQNTTNAVYDFQYWWSKQEYKIDVDGLVGPQTWHALGDC